MLLTGRNGQTLLIKTAKESLKAFKGLDDYRPYSDGWISCVTTIGGNPSILCHSQSLSATPLRSGVGVKKDRCIIMAHCTCMAGIGSHVAGLYLYHFMLMVTPSLQDVSYEPISESNPMNTVRQL